MQQVNEKYATVTKNATDIEKALPIKRNMN